MPDERSPRCSRLRSTSRSTPSMAEPAAPPLASARPRLMERYRRFLPIGDETPALFLGEGSTPLVHLRHLGVELGLDRLYAKVEGQNPTGSFKDRGMVV